MKSRAYHKTLEEAEAVGRAFFQAHHQATGARGLRGFQVGDWGDPAAYTRDHRLEPVPAKQLKR